MEIPYYYGILYSALLCILLLNSPASRFVSWLVAFACVLRERLTSTSAPCPCRRASSPMETSVACAHCGAEDAKKKCSACKQCYYCSVDCQRAAWPAHKKICSKGVFAPLATSERAFAAPAVDPSAYPHVPRTGGAWDDLAEQTELLIQSLGEEEQAKLTDSSSEGSSLLADLKAGFKSHEVKMYGNPPRYDRLIVWTTIDVANTRHARDKSKYQTKANTATYAVEAAVDITECKGWFTTLEKSSESELRKMGFALLDAVALEAEYAGALKFLECCKKLGAPRYSMGTDQAKFVAPEAKAASIALAERVLAACPLRFLLATDALERADAARKNSSNKKGW